MFQQIRAVIETANTELSLRLAPADMDALSERLASAFGPIEIGYVSMTAEQVNEAFKSASSEIRADDWEIEPFGNTQPLPDGTSLKIGDGGKMVPCEKDDPNRHGVILRGEEYVYAPASFPNLEPPFGKAPFEPFANALAEVERNELHPVDVCLQSPAGGLIAEITIHAPATLPKILLWQGRYFVHDSAVHFDDFALYFEYSIYPAIEIGTAQSIG